MALLEDLRAGGISEKMSDNLMNRAAAEIEELRDSMGAALKGLNQAQKVIDLINAERDVHKCMSQELRGEFNLATGMVITGSHKCHDTLRFKC